ncbi:hypothetical protein [Corynebacterium sp.]|uniref:hypothetical protein n=1 Tax=Corynebacterium sp. TaxID=1720 RepID=UPI0026DA9EBB|nr:hypothetical protein [Corynebacterium sp.]MDO5077208.1 hypothetical protein [Corynebacterium sp.]
MNRCLPCVLAALLCTLAAGCSAQQPELPSKEDLLFGRNPDEPVIKDVDDTGHCSPAVVSFEHGSDSSTLTYRGQPGDHVTYTLHYEDGMQHEREAEHDDEMVKVLHLSPTDTAGLARVDAAATGAVGAANSCVIEVSTAN